MKDKNNPGKTCSRIVLTVTGPVRSFQWFDQLTMSGISTTGVRSRRSNAEFLSRIQVKI